MSLIPLKRNKQEWDHDNHPYSFDNPNIYMRPATEDDVDNMYSWEMESIDKSLQEDPKVQQLIRDDCYQSIKDTQMIMDQDKTIGMFTACMIDNGEWRYIGEIYLIPEYRGQHIGSTILKNEIANYDRIRLQVAYDNENALRLYKSLGFKIVKENKEAKLYIMEYDKNSQDSSIKKVTLDEEYKTLYFGSKNEIDGNSIQLQNDELFVTPFITLASIFAVRPRGKDINLPRGSYNIGYDEWKKPIEELSQETEPLSEVHVIIEGLPDLKPFDYDSSGFIYVIDVEDVKDHLYQKDWMDDQREYIIKDLESVPIQKVIPIDAVCHIRGGDKMAEPVTEAFFKEAYLKAKERNSLKDSEFGIPELRKYPLTDETHINMAVKFFGKAPKKYKLSLAKRILRAAHSHDMDTDGWDTINDYIKNHKDKPIKESYTERKNFIMKEQITNILEAYNSGVLTQEEATEKIEAVQEQVVTESAVNTTDDLRVKQDKIMESFKMGIINATEGMRLIERVMMEADYITEEEDTAYEGDDDNEPEDITPEDTDGDTVDSDDTNIDALADYINSLSDDEKTALMSKLSGSDEPTDDDANGNEEVPTDDDAPAGEPTTEETVDPASVSDASLNDANASLDDMEV